MKISDVIILLLSLLLMGCSASEKSATTEKAPEIGTALFYEWRSEPMAGTELTERGTDLKLTINNWPDEQTPAHIIFRNKKSFPVKVSKAGEGTIEVSARIIHQSAILTITSETTPLSDRLVYTAANDEKSCLKITSWEKRHSPIN